MDSDLEFIEREFLTDIIKTLQIKYESIWFSNYEFHFKNVKILPLKCFSIHGINRFEVDIKCIDTFRLNNIVLFLLSEIWMNVIIRVLI